MAKDEYIKLFVCYNIDFADKIYLFVEKIFFEQLLLIIEIVNIIDKDLELYRPMVSSVLENKAPKSYL